MGATRAGSPARGWRWSCNVRTFTSSGLGGTGRAQVDLYARCTSGSCEPSPPDTPWRAPRACRLGQVHPDRLGPRVGLERMERHFLAPATLLESAEGTRKVVAAIAVYKHHAGVEPTCDAVCSRHIARIESGRKPVLARVGKLHGLVFVLERQHAEHRTEDLLPGNPHLGRHFVENCRAHKQALSVSSPQV